MSPLRSQEVVSDGTLEVLPLSFPYLFKSDVHVTVDFKQGAGPESFEPGTIWNWVGDVAIKFNEPVPAGSVVLLVRVTHRNDLVHRFTQGAQFNAPTLDELFTQFLYIYQEAFSDLSDTDGIAVQALQIGTEALATAQLALTTAIRAEGKADSALEQAGEALPKANEALDLARLALELAGGFAQVVELHADAELTPSMTGRWLRMNAPLSSSVRRLTVPNRSDWPPFCEVLLEQNGAGYAVVEAADGVTLRTQPGTSPIIRNGQAVACLKLFPGGEWVLFGALEDI